MTVKGQGQARTAVPSAPAGVLTAVGGVKRIFAWAVRSSCKTPDSLRVRSLALVLAVVVLSALRLGPALAQQPQAAAAEAPTAAPQPALQAVTLADLNRAYGDWRFYCNNDPTGDLICVATTKEVADTDEQASGRPSSRRSRRSREDLEDLLFVVCSRVGNDLRVIYQPLSPANRRANRVRRGEAEELILTLQVDRGTPIEHRVLDQSESFGGALAYMPIPAEVLDNPTDGARLSLQKLLVSSILRSGSRIDLQLSRAAETIYQARFSANGAYQALYTLLYQCQMPL